MVGRQDVRAIRCGVLGVRLDGQTLVEPTFELVRVEDVRVVVDFDFDISLNQRYTKIARSHFAVHQSLLVKRLEKQDISSNRQGL